MKKILSVLIVLFCAYFSNAQENNPFNQVGIDYVATLQIINEDFKAGKVKDFSTEAIQAYSEKLPLKTEVNMELVSKVFSTIKAKDFDLVKLIRESTLSDYSKEFLNTIAVNPDKFDLKKMNDYLIKKTEEIKKSEMGDNEKEMVLSVISIAYRINEAAIGDNNTTAHCIIEGPQGSGTINCTLAGALGGYLIGSSICGGLCGLGGAVIGGILGSLS